MNQNRKTVLSIGAVLIGIVIFLGESEMHPVLLGVLIACEVVLLACLFWPMDKKSVGSKSAGAKAPKAKVKPRSGKKRMRTESSGISHQSLYLRFLLVGGDRNLYPHEREGLLLFEPGKNLAITFMGYDFMVHCEEKKGKRRFVIPGLTEGGGKDAIVLEPGRSGAIRNDAFKDSYIALSSVIDI